MTNYKEINDSAGSQDIVAQSNSFFISSTTWQHPQHDTFTSLPLNENDSNILTHYYTTEGCQTPSSDIFVY